MMEDRVMVDSVFGSSQTFHYRVIASAYEDHFGDIDKQIIRRKVTADFAKLSTGGRVYRVLTSDLNLLPDDGKNAFLPVSSEGGGFHLHPDIDSGMVGNESLNWQSVE
jgi:hypothetical protein